MTRLHISPRNPAASSRHWPIPHVSDGDKKHTWATVQCCAIWEDSYPGSTTVNHLYHTLRLQIYSSSLPDLFKMEPTYVTR